MGKRLWLYIKRVDIGWGDVAGVRFTIPQHIDVWRCEACWIFEFSLIYYILQSRCKGIKVARRWCWFGLVLINLSLLPSSSLPLHSKSKSKDFISCSSIALQVLIRCFDSQSDELTTRLSTWLYHWCLRDKIIESFGDNMLGGCKTCRARTSNPPLYIARLNNGWIITLFGENCWLI